ARSEDPGTGLRMPGNALPEHIKAGARALATAADPALRHRQRIQCTAAGGADRIETDARIFQQAIKHAPCEGAVGTAALQGQIDARAGCAHCSNACPATTTPALITERAS